MAACPRGQEALLPRLVAVVNEGLAGKRAGPAAGLLDEEIAGGEAVIAHVWGATVRVTAANI